MGCQQKHLQLQNRNKRSHAQKAEAILRYRAEKSYYVSSDRSPGSWVKKLTFNATPAFPNMFVEWLKGGASHLQWRDRAGFSPDFPDTP